VGEGEGGEVMATWRESLARMAQATALVVGPCYRNMAQQPTCHSLGALGNLLYSIRRSLDDPTKAKLSRYADKVLIDISANRPLTSPGSASPTRMISEEHDALGRP
jgi:hypothetical protein